MCAKIYMSIKNVQSAQAVFRGNMVLGHKINMSKEK